MKKREVFLRKLLLDAGTKLKRQYGRVRTVHLKAGAATNLVTNVDTNVENFIKDEIRKNFPEDSILAEESLPVNKETPCKWVIDPVDGTTNFAHSFPLFAVSIGLEKNGIVQAGGVYNPIQEELFFAKIGKGATLNGKKILVSSVNKLSKSLLATGFPYDIHDHPERSLPYFNALIVLAQGMRRLGSASLDLCYVAMSRFDGFFEVSLNPWDTAAGCLILQEAGGMVTDFKGSPYSIYEREICASNGKIHSEMLRAIQRIKKEVGKIVH